MNTCKKIILSFALLGAAFPAANAAVPCGTSSAGVLNVGILPANLPYSAIVGGVAEGFDPLLITQVAKLLGYSTVNFIGFGSSLAALAALTAGTIDIYANSALTLPVPPTGLIGIVTDLSRLYASGTAAGWLLNSACCSLAERLDAAITQLVATGVYAQILQAIRLAGETNGFTLGVPVATGITGALLEPFPFASNEIGTIPAACAPVGPSFLTTLPRTNCIGAYLQANCTPGTTFTGATGLIPPS